MFPECASCDILQNLKSGSVLNFPLMLELKFCFEESFF